MRVRHRLRPSLLVLVWICASVWLLNTVTARPTPQDEGESEEEAPPEEPAAEEPPASDGGGGGGETAGGEPIENPGAEATNLDAAAAAAAGAVEAIPSPAGERPPGLSNLLDGNEPGESRDASAGSDGTVEPTSAGEGVDAGEAAAAGGLAGMLAGLQEIIKENAAHIAVGGISLAGLACVIGFSSKIIDMLKQAQANLPDISSLADELKKMDPTGQLDKLTENKGDDNGGKNDVGPDGDGGGDGSQPKEKSKLKSLFKKKGASESGAAKEQSQGLNDMASKKDALANESAPPKKKFLRKPDEIRSALKSKNQDGNVGGGASSNKLKGIAEGDEDDNEDLIGSKNFDEVASSPSRAVSSSKFGNAKQLKDFENIVTNPEQLEKLGEIIKQPVQLQDISKLIERPEQLKQLENIMENPSNLDKLERSIEASDKMDEMNNTLGRAQRLVNELELQKLQQTPSSYLTQQQPVETFSDSGLFTKPTKGTGDATDSFGSGGGGLYGESTGRESGTTGEKSEAIKRLDAILAKYGDDGNYATTGGRSAGGGYSEGYGSEPGSRGDTLTRASTYDEPFSSGSRRGRDIYGEEGLNDIQRPTEFEEDEASSSIDDPRIIADVAKKQSRVPSGTTKSRLGGVAGAVAESSQRARAGSPLTTTGKVIPAQSAMSAARKLPQPTQRTAASRIAAQRAIADQGRSSPVTAGIRRAPLRTASPIVDEYSSGDEFGRRSARGLTSDSPSRRGVQFRPEYDDNLLMEYQPA